MVIAYDGTHYSGWQIQPHSLSIQEKLEQTLQIFLREKVRIIGSGRTDAGVHALGQVAHFSCSQELNLERFLWSANSLLPPDIRVVTVDAVTDAFHAQHSAIGKEYHYHLSLGVVQEPFHRFYSYHIPFELNIDLLKQAAQMFIGTHDFTSFANAAHTGSAAKNPIRTLRRLDVVEMEQQQVRLEFEGDGFLYKMVRNITGTLLEVASGKKPLSAISAIRESRDRRQAPQAVPPQGLFLIKVSYP